MSGAEDLPAVDRAQLRHEIELRALHDGQAPGDRASAAQQAVEAWAQQRLAEIEGARVADEERLLADLHAAEATERDAGELAAGTARAVGLVERDQRRIRRILRGEERGDDGGDWSDSARLAEDPRGARRRDLALYGAAALADATLNYLGLRIMGTGPVETAVLAGAVVLVSVLLPKQLGELLARMRRTRRRTRGQVAVLAVSAAVWLAVAGFVALVRTGYLLLPTEFGEPPLVATAGLGPVGLTLGWLAVAAAVSAVVLAHSTRRHNPYAAAWHAGNDRLAGLRTRLVAERAAHGAAAARTVRTRDALARVERSVAPMVAECEAVAAELVACYEHTTARRCDSIERQIVRGPQALPPADEGMAS